MDIDLSALPDDLAALKAVVIAACAKADAVSAELANEQARRTDDAALIAHMKLQIEKLKRDKYGPKSERASRLLDQMAFELEELEGTATEDELAAERAAAKTTNVAPFIRNRPARKPFPDHLPRERVIVPGPTACTCCGGARLARLGETITETLETIPRSWKVIQHVREKFTCRDCEKISQAPAPFHVVRRGWAGPSFLAMLVFEKFGQHQPLNRQAERYAREGVPLSLSTLADQVGACCAVLDPIVDLLVAHAFAGARLHGDDTTLPVLAKGKTDLARGWVYVRDDRPFGGLAPPAAVFYYSRDRRGEHPQAHLAKYSGILQADAFGGYNKLYEPDRTPGPNLTQVKDRLNRLTSYAYDANRNLTSVTDPLGRTVSYGYDPDGRLTRLTDANGQKTSWTRDIEGRVTAKTYADGTSTKYAYDISGRLVSRTDALGQTTNYTYTTDDRVAKVSYSNAKNPTPTVSMTWDSAYPRIDAMTDGTGKTSFSYVPAGQNGGLQLAGETGPMGGVATYKNSYDALGRLHQLTVAGATQDVVGYDAVDRPISDGTTDGSLLGQFTTGYLGETDQISTVTALGQTLAGGGHGITSYGYLPNSGDRRLNTITFTANTAANETIGTDDADRVDTRMNGTTGSTETYTYDAADRLSYGSVAGAQTESFGYNNADFFSSKANETTASNNWMAATNNSLNQVYMLTPSGSTARAYTYDADGNVTTDMVNNYTWDAENRLLSIANISTGHVSSFTYDGMSRRVAIAETTGGTATTTGYLWCGTTICAAYSNGATTARYLPEGEIRYSGTTATPYFYEQDHLGTTVSMTSATGGSPIGTLATDAYGLTTASSGTLPTFAYAGMFLHQPSGIYLTKYRAYDPYSGRWLSRDPAGEQPRALFLKGDADGALSVIEETESTNLYSYVGEDPVNLVDLYGLWTFQLGIGFNGQFGPINLNGEGGIALDSNGNVGGYLSGGAGAGEGLGAFAGIHASGSSGDCIQDLGGPFGNEGGEVGDGLSGGGDWFAGPGSNNQPVVGGGFTIGVGGGAEASSGGSDTRIYPWFSF